MGWFDENHWMGSEAEEERHEILQHFGSQFGRNDARDASNHLPAGTRKCSKCKQYKTKKDFNKEQEKLRANKRICNDCGPPLPKDLSRLDSANENKRTDQSEVNTENAENN